jgi:hypothetical protein
MPPLSLQNAAAGAAARPEDGLQGRGGLISYDPQPRGPLGHCSFVREAQPSRPTMSCNYGRAPPYGPWEVGGAMVVRAGDTEGYRDALRRGDGHFAILCRREQVCCVGGGGVGRTPFQGGGVEA